MLKIDNKLSNAQLKDTMKKYCIDSNMYYFLNKLNNFFFNSKFFPTKLKRTNFSKFSYGMITM